MTIQPRGLATEPSNHLRGAFGVRALPARGAGQVLHGHEPDPLRRRCPAEHHQVGFDGRARLERALGQGDDPLDPELSQQPLTERTVSRPEQDALRQGDDGTPAWPERTCHLLEEQVLHGDEHYRAYARRVRFRVVPYVY